MERTTAMERTSEKKECFDVWRTSILLQIAVTETIGLIGQIYKNSYFIILMPFNHASPFKRVLRLSSFASIEIVFVGLLFRQLLFICRFDVDTCNQTECIRY